MTKDKIEELYEMHDELASANIKKGDRALANEQTWRRLFMWQFINYTRLAHKCMQATGSDCKEFRSRGGNKRG